MWLCLNNGFFSIVAPKGDPDDRLVVRARRKGDIERVFGVPGVYSPGRDYAYRALLERDVVASVVMCCVLGVDYDNFKSSVRDDALHRAYNRVWGVMGDLQVGGPYGSRLPRRSRGQRSLPGLGLPGGASDPDLDAARYSRPSLRRALDDSLLDLRDVDAGFGVGMSFADLESWERAQKKGTVL